MTDLHTHILPGMDDGAKNIDASIELLRLEAAQGVDTVVLTPHFHRNRERTAHFLSRRTAAAKALAAAVMALPEEERRTLPRLCLGAEIAWVPNLADWQELPELCLGKSPYFLLELPFSPWTDQMINQLYDLPGRTGLTPVIAHIERYIKDQPERKIEEIFSLGVPIQVSAEPFLKTFQRGKVLKLLKDERVQLIASDAHNTASRPPNLGDAMGIVRKKLGTMAADAIAEYSDSLLLQARKND